MEDLRNCDHGMYEYFDALERGEMVDRPYTWDEYDARGFYLCKVCEKCEKAKLSTYRHDVLTDSDYWHDEPLEPDDF